MDEWTDGWIKTLKDKNRDTLNDRQTKRESRMTKKKMLLRRKFDICQKGTYC